MTAIAPPAGRPGDSADRPATPGTLRVALRGLGVLGPGMADAAAALAALRDPAGFAWAPTALPAPARLPPAERRRAGAIVKLGLSVADQAVAASGDDPATLPTVFAAASGDGNNLHAMCEVLATPERLVSPTRFTNSVHNAAAGYWHIAVASRAPSTSLAAHDGSFGAGLLEAATQAVHTGRPVLFVAADTPYPAPLDAVRPIIDAFGVAMVLAPAGGEGVADGAGTGGATITVLDVTPAPAPAGTRAPALDDARLESLHRGVPAGRVLPLLQALAGGGPATCLVDYVDGLPLQVRVAPGAAR